MANATGQREQNFANPVELKFIGAILAEVNDRTRDQIGALSSSWVLHKQVGLSWPLRYLPDGRVKKLHLANKLAIT